MLFMNLSTEVADAFKSRYHEVSVLYRGKGISFLLGDLEASQGAFQVVRYLFIFYTLSPPFILNPKIIEQA